MNHLRQDAPSIWLLAALGAAGCHHDIADIDGVFSGGEPRAVHCAVDLDTRTNTSLDSIDSGLDRAFDRGEVVELYAHHPGDTVPVATIEHVLAGARDRGLAFITYDDFARGDVAAPGLALSFDDTSVQAWVDLIPLFAQYGARVTFFVSRYISLDDATHALLHQLADAGHAIEAHTVLHLHAPDYVTQYGLATYLEQEVVPSIDILRGDGFDVQAFAYPFGQRTEEIDRAILAYVPVLRSVSYTWSPAESPCPH